MYPYFVYIHSTEYSLIWYVLGMEHTLAVWVLITVLSSIAKKNAVGLSAIDKTKWVIKVKLLCICDDNFLDFVVVLRWSCCLGRSTLIPFNFANEA